MAGLPEVFDAPPPASYGRMRTGPVLLRSLVVTLPPVIHRCCLCSPASILQQPHSLRNKRRRKERDVKSMTSSPTRYFRNSFPATETSDYWAFHKPFSRWIPVFTSICSNTYAKVSPKGILSCNVIIYMLCNFTQ